MEECKVLRDTKYNIILKPLKLLLIIQPTIESSEYAISKAFEI